MMAHRFLKTMITGLALAVTTPAMTGVLDSEQWLADIDQLDAAIREHHFKPFHAIAESEWARRVDELKDRVETHSDHEIMTAMAALVAAIGDGHTRLTLPVQDWQSLYRFAHSSPQPPAHDGLLFDLLPLRFFWFDDGLHVTGATPGHRQLIAARVLAVEGFPVDGVLQKVATAAYRDNDQTQRFVVPNLLRMPQALAALGIANAEPGIQLHLRLANGKEHSVSLQANSRENAWVPDTAQQSLLRYREPQESWFIAPAPDSGAVYFRISAIDSTQGEDSLVSATVKAVELAARANHRLIIDLRDNAGGNGVFTRGALLALLQNEHVNRYGNLYVLTGRNTFSAAQFFVNELERFANVIFVGERTGATPAGYGDPKKLALANSGLTLRVSGLFWSSWLAGDKRPGTPPHVAVPVLSTDYFRGIDAGLQAILAHPSPATPLAMFENLLSHPDLNIAAIVLLKMSTDPGQAGNDIARDIIAMSRRLLDAGKANESRNAALIATRLFPASAELHLVLAQALQSLGERTPAARQYQHVLSLDPGNSMARKALDEMKTNDDQR